MIYIYIIDNHPEVDRDRILIFQNSPLSSGNHPEHSIQEAAAAAAAAQEEETGWAAAVSHATDVPTGAWKKHKFNAYIGNRWDLYGIFVAAWSWRLCRGMFFFSQTALKLGQYDLIQCWRWGIWTATMTWWVVNWMDFDCLVTAAEIKHVGSGCDIWGDPAIPAVWCEHLGIWHRQKIRLKFRVRLVILW